MHSRIDNQRNIMININSLPDGDRYEIAAVIAAPLGATYSTEKENFGEITNTFEVPADWQGYRYHGYCWAL